MNNFVIRDVNSDFPRLLESYQAYFNSVYSTTGHRSVENWTVSDTPVPAAVNYIVIPVSGFHKFDIPTVKPNDILVLDAYTESANCLTTDLVEKLKQYTNKLLILSNGTWDKDIFDYDLDYEIVIYPYWLISYSSYIASPHSVNYYQLTQHSPAPTKMFNCLVGVSRPERDYIVSKLVDKNLVAHNVVSYKGNFRRNGHANWDFTDEWRHKFNADYTEYAKLSLDTPPDTDLRLLKSSEWEDYGNFSLAYGRPWSGREHILPVTIFNDTMFSLVVETSVFNKNFHPTEKTLRNFLLKKPFIVFSSQHYVKYLHTLGFKTFGDFLDESYDSIECPLERCDAIIAETERICNEDIISKHQSYFDAICEHNYNHMSRLQQYYTQTITDSIGKFFINT